MEAEYLAKFKAKLQLTEDFAMKWVGATILQSNFGVTSNRLFSKSVPNFGLKKFLTKGHYKRMWSVLQVPVVAKKAVNKPSKGKDLGKCGGEGLFFFSHVNIRVW